MNTTEQSEAPRALVVDDSRATRTILAGMLQELGFAVSEAGDGGEGLRVLEDLKHVDIALVDWNMPMVSGVEFVQAVRASGSHDTTRLVMVTTQTETANVVQALVAGADEYIMKPFTKEILQRKLQILGFEEN